MEKKIYNAPKNNYSDGNEAFDGHESEFYHKPDIYGNRDRNETYGKAGKTDRKAGKTDKKAGKSGKKGKSSGDGMPPKKGKKNAVIIGIVSVFVLILLGLLVYLLFFGGEEKGSSPNSSDPISSLESGFVDLQSEPVSENDVVYKDEGDALEKPYLIQINKSQNCITIYEKNEEGKYTKPVQAMICSVGYDTPVGEFKTSDKYQWKIVNGNVWVQCATRVVGNVLIHSMPYKTNSKDTLITQYYNQLGSTLSASCVRVSAKDADWIMKNCPAGTTVQIYESDKEEPLERPYGIVVPEDAVWDPTDPDEKNPYQRIKLEFKGIKENRTVERGMFVNYMDGVKVEDTCGNDISSQVKVTSDLNSFELGTYKVTYSVQDATGKKAEAVVNYKIEDTTAPEFSGLREKMSFDSVADVTQDNILQGVYVVDNNEILDNSRVSAVIPTIVEGENDISLIVSDDYGNVTTANVTVSVHVKPPEISLKNGMTAIIPLSQNVDRAYALSRVTAKDEDEEISAQKIQVSIVENEWGYSFTYKVVDENGYEGVLYDTVTYVEYSINVPEKRVIKDINDTAALLEGVTVKDNQGSSADVNSVKVQTTPVNGTQYEVKYSYTYTSPLGSKTVEAKTVVEVEKKEEVQSPEISAEPLIDDEITESAEPTEPVESILPVESALPQEGVVEEPAQQE